MDLIEYHLKECPEECKNLPNISISYGTSGFRYEAKLLPSIVYRVGILAALRSKFLNEAVGVMVTASHNPEEDNGVKIIDGNGEMLCQEWEKHATDICTTPFEQLSSFIDKFSNSLKINTLISSSVYTGQDTRKSGDILIEYLFKGIHVLPFIYHYNYGITATPILHFLIKKGNCDNILARESDYFDQLALGYSTFKLFGNKIRRNSLIVDAANGVGAQKLHQLILKVSELDYIIIKNDGSTGRLNYLCGADYVKINQSPPPDFELAVDDRCASFDGDADRIVFFFKTNTEVVILDGDYISVLFIHYITNLLQKIQAQTFKLGFVHAAYSNSAAIDFAKSKAVETFCTKTGVKHLHLQAKNYDIGVYFEANGHGTVLFSPACKQALIQVEDDNSENFKSAKKLLSLIDIINQTNGDAISNLFAVEIMLSDLNLSFTDWKDLMNPMPYAILKIPSKKKDIIVTSLDEKSVLSPQNMQEEIDQVINAHPGARAFLRPSGTENVIRVFAEASNQQECEDICERLRQIVLKHVPE